jgi:hypothetical protein
MIFFLAKFMPDADGPGLFYLSDQGFASLISPSAIGFLEGGGGGPLLVTHQPNEALLDCIGDGMVRAV